MPYNFALAAGANVGLAIGLNYLHRYLQEKDYNGKSRIIFASGFKREQQARRAQNYLLSRAAEGKLGQVVDRNFVASPLQPHEVRGQDDQRIRRIFATLEGSNAADFGFFTAEGIAINFFYVTTATPQMYAFADGTIIVFKEFFELNADGTPKYADSVIASALAHELAHVLFQHDIHRSSLRIFGTMCSLAAAISVPSMGVPFFGPTVLWCYGTLQFAASVAGLSMYIDWNRARNAEDEADELGLRWALRAGYDIRDSFVFMVSEFKDSPQSMKTRFYSSHRALLDRAQFLDDLITRTLTSSPALAEALPQDDPRPAARLVLAELEKADKK